MRAVVLAEYGSFETAEVKDVAEPEPKAGEVLIEVHAAPVNYVDLVVTSGRYQFLPPLPFTPGKGPTGIVKALGAGVTSLKVGDRVLAMAEQGGYAQSAVAPASSCYVLPDKLSFADAGAMSLIYDTSWFALRDRGRLKPGETVLVLGASGGVGLAAIYLAKAMGAGQVLAGVSSPARYDLAKAAGADAMIDLSQPNLRDSLRDQVHAATGGRGADVVLDPLGDDIFDAALRAVAWCGRVVVIGFAAGRIPSVKVNYLMVKNMEVSGLQVSDYRKRRPEQVAQCYAEVFRFYEEGKVAPPPVTTLPLDEFKTALRMIEGRKAAGRIVLLPR